MTFTQTLAAPKSQSLAQLLMQNRPDYASSKSPMEGLAKMLTEWTGAYSGKKKADESSAALAQALQVGLDSPAGLDPKTGINWEQSIQGDRQAMIAQLLNNPNTADVGQQMAMGQIGSQMDLENAIAREKALLPIEIQKAQAIAKAKAAGVAGGSKVMADALQLSEALGIDIGTAYSIAKSGVGSGNTFSKDGVAAIGGKLETAKETKHAEATGTNLSDLQYKPLIKGAEKAAEVAAGEVGDINKSLAEIQDFNDSIARYKETIDATKMTGPLGAVAGAVTQDPGRTNLKSAQNELTLRAKGLLGMPSANFSDADRDFIKAIVGGDFARAGGLKKAAERLEEMAVQQQDRLIARKAHLTGGSAMPSAPNEKKRLKYNPTTGELE